jgi:hypothetical protein
MGIYGRCDLGWQRKRTIPISGPDFNGVIASGPTQNVTSLTPLTATTMGVQDNAAITVQGATAVTSGRGLAYCEEAFTFACADLDLPGGVDMADRKRDDQLKMSMRVVRAYDINMDRFPLRIDLLGGWATLYPQLAVRIAS